ncbi:MAG: adenine nucleotide alpha hydrolase family protein [Deltaproteobacteria bacterium]|nr:adenine nucleotide alpha hydrolase family protein [Deltaproteobacteria bacterium]
MKCRRCKKNEAEVVLRRHNAVFCRDCFLPFFENQVKRAISEFGLFSKEDRILVCVSGGKDSLVLWDILLRMGYKAEGMYIDLGIGDYSEQSGEKVKTFAVKRELEPIIVDLEGEGMGIPGVTGTLKKKECSLCGIVKRHFFNAVPKSLGHTVVATGHNLDDEASRLLGNFLHWNKKYIEKQHPLLRETQSGMVRKVKPLVRLTEYETACYALIREIDYMPYECPYSRGATSLVYKEALNSIEESVPGTKARFLFGLLGGELEGLGRKREERGAGGEDGEERKCSVCSEPSFTELCAYCRLKDEVEKKREKGKRRVQR